MKNTKQIGSRIREVVDRAIEGKVYRSRAAFARTLGMTPQNFKNLIDGRGSIGLKTRDRLESVGLDWKWIIQGRSGVLSVAEEESAYMTGVRYRVVSRCSELRKDGEAIDRFAYIDFEQRGHAFVEITDQTAKNMRPMLAAGDLLLLGQYSIIEEGSIVAFDGPSFLVVGTLKKGKIHFLNLTADAVSCDMGKLYRVACIVKSRTGINNERTGGI